MAEVLFLYESQTQSCVAIKIKILDNRVMNI